MVPRVSENYGKSVDGNVSKQRDWNSEMDSRGKDIDAGEENDVGATSAGGVDPLVVESWVQEMEKMLVVLSCTEAQKVLFTTFKLTGEAKRWWQAVKLLEEQRYIAKFMELSSFAPFMVPNEFQKARWFERGLKSRIHKQVVVLKVQSFLELVDKATVAELSLQRSAEMAEQRKRPMPPSFSNDAR
ncbi:uncharacterized protein LOC131160844 [Malania oleifera]|uniref:uncharacterized protein LOC131160844 n=1 Tax=Malania oleifera TaxID=397392 RepID=UPI0025AE3169|nr:uncharacterized protein LOC131160844 [Malania oleifera]